MTRSTCACLVVALALVGACHMGPSTVQYRVAGTATTASITYATPDGDIEQTSGSALPWSRSFPAASGDVLTISAQNDKSTGCVTVSILKGETVLNSAQSCGAYVIASTSARY